MKQSVEQFYEELADCLQRYLPGGETEVIEMNMLRLKVRIYIAVSFFMDVFYAVRTQKISFALVQKGKRIFGIDDLDGWHFHPFGKPEDHVQMTEPSIESMVMQCTRVIRELDRKQ